MGEAKAVHDERWSADDLNRLSAYLRSHAKDGRWMNQPRQPRRGKHAGGRPRGSGTYHNRDEALVAILEAYDRAREKAPDGMDVSKAATARELGCARSVIYWYLDRFGIEWPPV